jgi:hypothetical protein
MRLLSFCLAGVLMASSSPAAFAQSAPAASICNGTVVLVRVSEIKPGMMPTFLKAVDAQAAWYAAAPGGAGHKISVARVMDNNESTHTATLSETQALTYHAYPATEQKQIPHDAGYAAFVKLFQESSTIKTSYLTCMTKLPGA